MSQEKKEKQFHELTECELNDLRQAQWDRAVLNKRELLNDVRCVREQSEDSKNEEK